MIKGPSLLCIDCRSGEVRRYIYRYVLYPAPHGWRAEVTHKAKGVATGDFGGPDGLAILERFRQTGAM